MFLRPHPPPHPFQGPPKNLQLPRPQPHRSPPPAAAVGPKVIVHPQHPWSRAFRHPPAPCALPGSASSPAPTPPAFEAARLRLRAAAEAELEERSAALTAEIAYLDGLEDAEVSSLARELRVLVGGNLKDPRWTSLFSTAPTELVERRKALEAAHRAYNRVMPQLKLLFDSAALLRSIFPPSPTGAAEEAEGDKA